MTVPVSASEMLLAPTMNLFDGYTATSIVRRALGALTILATLVTVAAPLAMAQEAPLAWDQVQNFQYNILNVAYDSQTRVVTVVFSVTNPKAGNAAYDILGATAAAAIKSPAALRVDVAWNSGNWGTSELLNTKDDLTPAIRLITTTTTPAGTTTTYTTTAPASAAAVNALTLAKRCDDVANGSPCGLYTNAHLTYWVRSTLPQAASGSGRVGIEGRPSITTVDPATSVSTTSSVPVKSVYRDFLISSGASARRQIVDVKKCQVCHDNRRHGKGVVPRLSLHGANRNEEPGVCVMCHNPDQTDAAYRTSGAEESVDFKRMIHAIHGGGMRKSPLIIIGRNGSVNDYSHVRFPASLKNCMTCHLEVNRKGTFELPLATTLGSTINTMSVLNSSTGQIDVNPANNLRISPIAATCSGCHDDRETRRHMIAMGATFGDAQPVLSRKEQCVTCHGPGKHRDVRKEHDISSTSTATSTRRRRDD